jgi:hypothetical protein
MGFMQVMGRVCVCYGENFHSRSYCGTDTRDGVLNHQTGSGCDSLLSALSSQSVESVEKGGRIGLSSGYVFRAGDVKKLFVKPCLFKNHVDLMAEGAGRDG